MSAPATLAIAHVETSSPPAFILTRLSDGKSAAPVDIFALPVPRRIPAQLQSHGPTALVSGALPRLPLRSRNRPRRTRPRRPASLGHTSLQRPLRPPRRGRMAGGLRNPANSQRRPAHPLLALGSALRSATQLRRA